MKQNNPSPFLAEYNTLIFDMDGVVTSEERYWDSAALTVYELLGNPIDDAEQRVAEIRNEVFYGDRLIKHFKNAGINSNWDLAYVVYAAYLEYGRRLPTVYKQIKMQAFELCEWSAEVLSEKMKMPVSYTCRLGDFWHKMQDVFQEWFLGSKKFGEVYGRAGAGGKAGLMEKEEPLFDREALHTLFSGLKSAGKRLCIGTGRPKLEIETPLKRWDMRKYFDEVINYNDVVDAEKETGVRGLTKPHPFMFLKAYLGREVSNGEVIEAAGQYSDCLVIGDAGADLYAAHAMKSDFLAVLTGISGEEAREFFEKDGARFILTDVTEMWK